MMISEQTYPNRDTVGANQARIEQYHDEGELLDVSFSGQSTSTSAGRTASQPDLETGAADGAKELRETVIKVEEGAVRKSRMMVGTAVVLCSIAVSVAVYFIAARSDQNSFELEYEDIVNDIKTLVRWEVRYNFALMEQLSASISIAAGYLNSSFPFHTEPQYEISGGFVDGMGGIMSAAFAPLVLQDQRTAWETYSREHQGWIEQSAYLKKVHPEHRDALHGTLQDHEHDRRLQTSAEHEEISRSIFKWVNGSKVPEVAEAGKLYAPLWQVSPADYGAVNVNLLSDPVIASLYQAMLKRDSGVLSSNFEVGDIFDFLFDPEEKVYKTQPHAYILQPVYGKIEEKEHHLMVGFLIAITPFGNLLDRLLPAGKDGVIGVYKDDCGNIMSFELSSTKARFLGYEDLHEQEFDNYERVEMNIEMYPERIEGICTHDLYIYPSAKLRETYTTTNPIVYTTLVAMAFAVVIGLFIFYDWTITRRQNKTITTALKTQAIVTSLFPEEVGKRMINEAHNDIQNNAANKQNKYRAFRNDPGDSEPDVTGHNHLPTLAQLYPETTVMFADLVGFTAWSSLRSPDQVFRLLETIYSAFDEMANRRRVFKVETVGDCYVAVCGLPQKRQNHQVVMARFASDCLEALAPLLRKLERELGPDTTDLAIRIGLNSGPVTAGVLRGDRARFQLFGDTVNTAARMESTCVPNSIQMSQSTADLLVNGGRGHWVVPRDELVSAKGKGQLKTFWLHIKNDGARSTYTSVTETSSTTGVDSQIEHTLEAKVGLPTANITQEISLDPKTKRLVEWNTDILLRLLCRLTAHRQALGVVSDAHDDMKAAEDELQKRGGIVFDELSDTILLPRYGSRMEKDPDVSLDQAVVKQLRHYVASIASMYRTENEFHNFEHASHVTMSVNKLMNRIIGMEEGGSSSEREQACFGITNDPVTQFAVVLSALVHDVDHYGVPNAQLVNEGAVIADKYKGRSVLEQNSVDVAWELLMHDSYTDLRRAIYCNKDELKRFRQIVVAAVMATDITDVELREKRNARWAKAFKSSNTDSFSEADRKAIIVIEHIIQASDIAHTMQHWHIYRKWNERLFMEMYAAYRDGRAAKDPSQFWYKGELGFFDFYIIPLARKLKECGVFGVSSDEYLSYALKNRQEWVVHGAQAVESYLLKVKGDD